MSQSSTIEQRPAPAGRGDSSRHAYARIVGFAYLAITLCGAFGVGLLDARLVTDGDHLATADNITAHMMSFQLGIVSVLVIYASVLIAAWAMYLILHRVDRQLALLGLLFRVAEAIVGFATMLTSLTVTRLLRPDGPAAALGKAEVAAWVGTILEVRTAALDIVLSLIGVGGTVFLVLFWRSWLIPRWLSSWGIFTYLSMLCLSFVSLLYADHPRSMESALYGLGATFEGVFAFWMLWKGLDAARWRTYEA